MIVPMIDQALAQARMLIGADPQQGGVRPPERAKYEDEKGRTFTRVPAREWRRLLNEALPRVGLLLVTESETLTGGDLTVTFSLTHVGCGDTRTLTRAEPLPPAKSRSMGKQWAHTRAVNAVARTLLWQWDDEDEAADDAEDDAEKVQREDRAPRPRGQRPTRATRATNTLAGVLTGQVGEPAIELGQAEQEQEEQRAAEAEKAAEERAAAQPSAPVADPDWLKERADVPPLEDRLRVELERTRDQIQTREAAEDGTASPAPGSLLGAAPKVDADVLSNETSTTAPGAVPDAAPPNADPSPSTHGVPPAEAGEESSPAPEVTPPDSPGQGASTTDGPCDAFEAQGNSGRSSWWCARCDYHEEDHTKPPAPEEPTFDRPSGEPDGEWCPDCDHEVRIHDDTGCQVFYGDGSGGSLLCECERPPHEDATCRECGDTAAKSAKRDNSCGNCGSHEWVMPDEAPLTEPTPSQVTVVGNVAARVGASEDSGPAPDPLSEFSGRRAMTAKENAKPVKCALCGEDVEPLAKYYAGSSRSRRAHVGCVTAGEQGRKPRKVGT